MTNIAIEHGIFEWENQLFLVFKATSNPIFNAAL